MFSHVTERSVTLPARIQPPETFDFSTPNEWPKWRKRFERYLVVSGMKKKEEADKIDLFMYLMGDRADDIFRTFKFEKEEEATKIDSVLKAFDSHFCVRKNIIYERAKFNSRNQEDREPVDEFITSLYKLADSCEFEGLHEQLIRDRIVVGVRDKALSERMQLDSELTLEKAVKMVRQQEAVRQQQVDLQRPSTSQRVNQVKFNSKKQSPKQQQQPSMKKEKSAKTRSRCPKCGGFTHREGQACRDEGQRYKQAKTAEVKAVSELEEIGFLLEVSAVEDSSNLDNDEDECRRRWTAEIQVNGKKVKFKLDSQADVTCVPLCLFKKIMGQQRLVKSDINIRAAEFSELQTVGMSISTLRNGNYEIKEKIYVIRRLSEPLLSRRACELLNLARRIEVGATRINPVKEFPEVHIPGKELLDADALSRQLLTTEGGEDERPTSAHINAVLSSITDKDEMLTKIFEAQQEDTTLKAVVNYLEQGWPDKKKMSQALLSYWHVKDELGVQNGLLMRSCRLVIPASMKLEILDKLHAGHFGITKTRLRARETVWWPGISEEIAETVRKCSVCIQEAVSKHEPLIPTNFPTRPWQKIGMDLFKFENKWYLVVIDYYSRFPEMIQLDRLTANVVVRSCKSIFARHGIPETVVSDNGTQFGAAREFANFARQYGFTHVTSSPRFPQSNGMAEAGVKIAKLILNKNQDPSLGLLEYRSTPLENGYSPAELLMGRKLRTTLPIAPENLNPKLVDSQTLKRKEGRRRKNMKSRYDRRCGATDMEELSEVVMKKEDYNDKIKSLLNDNNTYEEIREDPTKKIKLKISKFIKNMKSKDIDKRKMKLEDVAAPLFKGLPKIHKEGVPLRPIVSGFKAPTRRLADWLKKQCYLMLDEPRCQLYRAVVVEGDTAGPKTIPETSEEVENHDDHSHSDLENQDEHSELPYNLRPNLKDKLYYELSSDDEPIEDNEDKDPTYDPTVGALKLSHGNLLPSSYEEAINHPDSPLWQQAMDKEIHSLQNHHVWDLTELPEGAKAIKSKWIFSKKMDPQTNQEIYKARLVALGCSQEYGTDYTETFSPVMKTDSFRTLLAYATMAGYEFHHFDVETAFLYGKLSETIYMTQPPGYQDDKKKTYVCILNQALYGLKQSGRMHHGFVADPIQQDQLLD
ncbi:hypothetical protein LAZ67_3001707 [Cordylochernes scorpioides]|uniref:RNA-directed DNA polymerase n=1 Tax=Cordylochernes scorpioides TaxID=51811 RepID=A0ABY6K836_9ARAC|nr:hypothetical protein LAZ67_3001707 [Cordylochernes scorpioides]